MHIVTKFSLFILSAFLLTAASQNSNSIPLIDNASNPKGLAVPKSFLGLHLNRWSEEPSITGWDVPMPGIVTVIEGKAFFTCKKGYRFSFQRIGVTIILQGMGENGADFETIVTGLEYPENQFATVAKLAKIPPKTGSGYIRYPVYIPTFGYSAVRSHDTGINWATLNPSENHFNSKLMTAWIKHHAGKKIMFTVSGTPEWLAASNIDSEKWEVLNNEVKIYHKALSMPLPSGSKIKIRNCKNQAINGEWIVKSSTTHYTTFLATLPNEHLTLDNSLELLLWSNSGNYGYMNPPKDFSKVNLFVKWLMTNYGNHIFWIEGPNEANSGHTPKGEVWYSQGHGLWWAGSMEQLGEITRRINQSAKSIKPNVLVGAPSITGLHTGQPINMGSNNRANSYQMLSASDGLGGKLVDWVDFIPFHIYDYGASWQMTGKDRKTLYDNLIYLKVLLATPQINKANIDIYMNEGGFEHYGNYKSPAKQYFDSLTDKQQANEVFKIAAIYAGFGVKGFYPYMNGFLGDFETKPAIAAAYDKINKRIAGKTISPDAWFNKETGEMFFKTTDGYEENIP